MIMDWREALSCLGRACYFLFVATVIITAIAALAGCQSYCSIGFKGPLYFHTHDGDMACRYWMVAERP